MVAFDQPAVAGSRAMHEDIVAAVVRGDEAEAFGRIVALDGAGHQRKAGDIDIAVAAATAVAVIATATEAAATGATRLGIRVALEDRDVGCRRALHARASHEIDPV